jgi:hypothetical protein
MDMRVMRTSIDKRAQKLKEELIIRIQGIRIEKRGSPAEWTRSKTDRIQILRRTHRNTSGGADRIKAPRFDDFITRTLVLSPVRERGQYCNPTDREKASQKDDFIDRFS